MSRIKIQEPIVHIPSLLRYRLPRVHFVHMLEGMDIRSTEFPLDSQYVYLSLEDWGKILWDLAFKSSLYKTDVFDCEDYALKAQTVCAERYGVNALRLCIGETPFGYHGFNLLFFGNEWGLEGIMLWEPNDGFDHSGEFFKLGEYGYKPDLVLL